VLLASHRRAGWSLPGCRNGQAEISDARRIGTPIIIWMSSTGSAPPGAGALSPDATISFPTKIIGET
jgi:hypothetical protein